MPTTNYFSRYPNFPSDVATANIPVISLTGLQEDNHQDSQMLYNACREYGFFLLNLNDSQTGRMLLRDGEKMFDLGAEVMSLGDDVLQKYAADIPRDLIGYKAIGKTKTDYGKSDVMEMYSIEQDDIMGTSKPRAKPDVIEAKRDECKSFVTHAHQTACIVLGHLDRHLDLLPGTLAALGPLHESSASSLRMIMSKPGPKMEEQRIAIGGHTDIGALTILFNVVGGLQMLPAGSENINENWLYIRPTPGCAIVNIGDALAQWTGGVLRSNIHRVLDPPGEQAGVVRQSLGYFLRPGRKGTMKRLKGSTVIPKLVNEEEEETLSVDDWATWKASQIIAGAMKAKTTGGCSLASAPPLTAARSARV